MTTAPPLRTFTICEPYDDALRMVRTALSRQGLRAATELDVRARIRHELGAGVAPCMVLYVDDPATLLEAVVFNRGAALLIPQPLAIAGHNRETKVLMRTPALLARETPDSVRGPVRDLLKRMTLALESIAERLPAEDALAGESPMPFSPVPHHR